VLLGGAGGLGTVFSRWLAAECQATLVWVGRRAEPPRGAVAEVEAAGGRVVYLQADATDPDALAAALAPLRRTLGGFHGAVHSALVLRDQRIPALDEASFRAALAPKVWGSVALGRALAGDPLDFLLFFSSAQSLAPNPGQSNYAAGCAFKDAFAAWLGGRAAFPVRTVNWGFWGSVGAVASEPYRRRMEALGVGSIEPPEGIEAVRRLLSHPVEQLFAFKGSGEVLTHLGVVDDHERELYPATRPAPGDAIIPPVRPLAEDAPAWEAVRGFGRHGLAQALGAMGVLPAAGARLLRAELCGRLTTRPGLARLAEALVDILVEAGFLQPAGDQLCVAAAPPRVDDWQRLLAAEQATLGRAFPAMAQLCDLLGACLAGLPDVLGGTRPATEILFPGSSMARVERIYRGNATADYFNGLCAQVARRLVEALPGQRVRVLEVGAGTGGTSEPVLAALAPLGASIEYLYTDVSRAFLAHGRKHFGHHGFVRFALLDVEQDPEAQGIEPGAFDLVIATNVLHATRRMRETLARLKVVLRRGATLLINEATRGQEWMTLVFGLLDGWWAFEDPELRLPGSPLLDPPRWRAALAAEGFEAVRLLGEVEHGQPGQHVILARSDGLVRRRRDGTRAAAPPPNPPPPNGANGKHHAPGTGEAIRTAIAEVLDLPLDRIDRDEAFLELGIDSVLAVEIAGRIADRLGVEVPTTDLFNHPSVAELERHLLAAAQAPPTPAAPAAPATAAAGPDRRARIEAAVSAAVGGVLEVEGSRLGRDEAFADFGVDSVLAVEIVSRINDALGADLRTTDLFSFASIRELADHLAETLGDTLPSPSSPVVVYSAPSSDFPDLEDATPAAPAATPEPEPLVAQVSARPADGIDNGRAGALPAITSNAIAIIGMAGRFPGAPDLDALWELLREGRSAIGEVPPGRWNEAEFFGEAPRRSDRPRARHAGLIDDIDAFDSLFFGISPKEAEMMDPQQRLFLEEAWKALEDAGYAGAAVGPRRVGVYVGCAGGDYRTVLRQRQVLDEPATLMGNSTAILPARLSYLLNLGGPSLALDTACSSALVAIHLACEGLRGGTLEMAVAGGTMVMTTPEFSVLAGEAGMLSPDGSCRPFDRRAAGIVPSEGVGVVVLKRLDAALADGDPIHALIRGSAVNQDGRTNGITAPSGPAQTAVELEAWQRAGIGADELDYVEAHGTGTRLGDPIEVAALCDAFRRFTDRRQFCALGSVKGNLGHTVMAAGVASLLKVVLALRHGKLPPSIGFDEPNEHIRFAETPFFVPTSLREWPRAGRPRRAAISSFGFSGTNAHLVVEEPPAVESTPAVSGRAAQVCVLSARSEAALRRRAADLCAWLAAQPGGAPLTDIAYTLLCRRNHFPLRAAWPARDLAELARGAASLARGQSDPLVLRRDARDEPNPPVVAPGEIGRHSAATLAELYTRGAELPWRELFPQARPARLPTYPFERTSAWIGPPPTARPATLAATPAPRPLPVAGALPADFAPLVKDWQLCPDAPGEPPAAGTFVVLTNEETLPFARRLAAEPGPLRFRALDPGAADLGIAAARDLAASLLKSHDDLRGLIDLSDLYRSPRLGVLDCRGRLTLVSRLVGAAIALRQGPRFHFLHLSRSLVGFRAGEPSLAGASFAGVARVLAAEYQRVVARTVDVDVAADQPDALARLLERELSAGDAVAEICVRAGQRFRPHLSPLAAPPLSQAAPTLPLDRVLCISGGTGGIGRLLARHFVERGGRKLALLGLDSLPARPAWPQLLADPGTPAAQRQRILDVVALEEQGASIDLYMGRLTDAGALGEFLAEVRSRRGPLGTVIHCAGAFVEGHPPLIHRDAFDVARVMEPKVEGLVALARAVENDDLAAFVLFSSISALAPSLAVGIADYSMANAFLGAFAEAQFRRGRRCFQSLYWSNWRDVGIGEVDNANYRQLALRTHSSAQGLAMLEQALAMVGQVPALALTLAEPDRFVPDALLAIRHSQRDKERFVRGDQALRQRLAEVTEVDAAALAFLRGVFAHELKIAEVDLDDRGRFEEMGVDSILLVDLLRKLEQALGETVDPTAFLEYPTLRELTKYLGARHGDALARLLGSAGAPAVPTAAPGPSPGPGPGPDRAATLDAAPGPTLRPNDPIAVVGLACHFPHSPDAATFFANLCAGFDGIGEVPAERWSVAELYRPTFEPGRSVSKWGGFIDGIELFDPGYFGLSETVAPQVDPLIRQFLEVAVECFREAGYGPAELGRTRAGVFVGSRVSTYAQRVERALPDTVVGVGQNFIASHLSHLLDLRGPAVVVDSACSSSLVSLHLACQALRAGDCELALAGGVDLLLDEIPYLTLSEARALSPRGRCRTFDESADGFVPGEGAGAVLLKPLARALADSDRIFAVLEGSAVGNDGRTMGITTPNPEAQAEVIRAALERAGASADTVSYIEAHGTGTMIGDPIELRGLGRAFAPDSSDRQFCGVGSVKSNIGHLFSAAGIASFIKVCLSLFHQKLPPTLHCQRPNPRFAFDRSPFYPVTRLCDWAPRQGVRRAGISSFGFGGTNAHVVVREPAERPAGRAGRPPLEPVRFDRRRFWLEKRKPTPATPPPAAPPPLLELRVVPSPKNGHARETR
jgi:acyl transferase domain-containing protein/acyl carrier protein/NAD(P)-dependent dehydrogenase (short-subunit alcohol dehydrogenase family)/ubiquinone/menaquinone biosynthesis C-methylase UbiE